MKYTWKRLPDSKVEHAFIWQKDLHPVCPSRISPSKAYNIWLPTSLPVDTRSCKLCLRFIERYPES